MWMLIVIRFIFFWFRHVDVLKTGLEARRNGDVAEFQSLFHQQSDISMLQLFESFMKSAPQLVLQLYIMIQVHDWGPWTGNTTIVTYELL